MAEFPTPHTPTPNRRVEDKYKFSAMLIIPVALMLLLSFTLVALIFVDARPNNHDILLMVITFITAKLGTIVDHHFGSSASAQRKEEIIGMQAKTMQTAQETLSAVAPLGEAGTLTLKPGETAEVTSTKQGATIEKGDLP